MHVPMVKKQLSGGAPCRKCAQAEDLLRSRNLWTRIDAVVLAEEDDPSSPGMKLAAKFGIETAPFFIVRDDDGTEVVYESVLKLIKDRLAEAPPTVQNFVRPDLDPAAMATEFAQRS